jgi:hypothetical protein
MASRLDGRAALGALVAGLAGAATVEAYLFAVGLASWPGTYQWIASGLVGAEAFASLGFAWLGLAIHVGVSLGWAVGWAMTAARWPRLPGRPVLAGLGYGAAVFVAMQGVAALAGIWTAPTPGLLLHYLVDHTVFFGLPVVTVFGRVAGPPRRVGRSLEPLAAPGR